MINWASLIGIACPSVLPALTTTRLSFISNLNPFATGFALKGLEPYPNHRPKNLSRRCACGMFPGWVQNHAWTHFALMNRETKPSSHQFRGRMVEHHSLGTNSLDRNGR